MYRKMDPMNWNPLENIKDLRRYHFLNIRPQIMDPGTYAIINDKEKKSIALCETLKYLDIHTESKSMYKITWIDTRTLNSAALLWIGAKEIHIMALAILYEKDRNTGM